MMVIFKTGFIKETLNTNWEDLVVLLGMVALRQRVSIFTEMPQNSDSQQGNG